MVGIVAVAASRVRFEEKAIFAELEERKLSYVHLDPRRVVVEPGRLPSSAEGDSQDVSVVLNRELSQTRGLYLAALYSAARVPVVNSFSASELCYDKVRTAIALQERGLPAPRTRVALTPDAARAAAAELAFPFVIKPVIGSWGRMVSLIRDPDALEAVLDHRDAMPSPQQHIVMLQEYIDKPERDIRAIVVGGKLLGAMYRMSRSWRTNAARGATTQPCVLDEASAKLAVDAAAAVGADIAGVDLIEDRAGRVYVLEVNHVVEFRAFSEAHGGSLNVASAIVDHVVAVTNGQNHRVQWAC